MNSLNKKIIAFFAFIFLFYGIETIAYKYRVYNNTDTDVKIRLYYFFGELTNKKTLIKKHTSHLFSFGGAKAGLCLNKIKISVKNQKLINAPLSYFRGLEVRNCADKDITLHSNITGRIGGAIYPWGVLSMWGND